MKLKTLIHILALALPGIARAAQTPVPAEHAEFFETRIRPLLNDKCVSCHGPEKQKGGLRLDSLQAALDGGDSGAALVPGDPNASHLIKAVRYQDEDLKMPPKNPLTKAQIADLEKWVALGAPWPGQVATAGAKPKRGKEITAEDRAHWAFQPLRPLKAASIDELVRPAAPEADRRTLVRRLYFDLIGLPPLTEDLTDPSDPSDLTDLIDKLLASPHHGEKWARHWLDVVRFAESNGHNRDPDKPNMWRYRDYVIQAFNDDLPYDQFLREQIAGDLMPPRPMADGKTNARLAATGLWWSYELVYNPAEPAEQRADQVDSQLDILGKAFLGLSIACARCHDHKTDPIPTRDYYALAGIFHSTKGVQRPVSLEKPAAAPPPIAAAPSPETAVREARLAEIRRAKDYLLATAPLLKLSGADALREAETIAKDTGLDLTVLRRWVSFLKLNTTPRNPNLGPWAQIIARPPEQFREAVADIVAKKDKGALDNKPFNPLTMAALTAPDTTSIEVLAAKYQAIMLEVFNAQREDDPAHHQWLNWFRRPDTPYTASVFAARPGLGAKGHPEEEPKTETAMAMACAEADDPRFEVYQVRLLPAFANFWSLPRDPVVGDVPVHIRGQVGSYGEIVPRGFLSVLPGGGPAKISIGSGRRELADWLTGPAAPLVARVMVNRLWQHYFGTGLVATPNDFGKTGAAPTHPELLDWLAARFIESGWSLKAMHRLIVNSAVYRQACEPLRPSDRETIRQGALRPALSSGLPVSWSRPIRRLEAEAIRDAILAVSGSLDPRLHGPGVTPHITEFMYPRFRPKSGPLDGAGRRSLYITVRRNFLTPMLTAFDFPNPSEPVGKRETSNVPTQALTMLNNEFIHQQARRWGERVAREPGSDTERIARMFERALARPPDADELAAMLEFVNDEPDPVKRWADLAHALFNTKDFIFIR